MDNNTECHFIDKTVTFDQFVNELATMIALRIHQVEKGQLEISQPDFVTHKIRIL